MTVNKNPNGRSASTASAYLTLSGTYSGTAEYVKVGTVTVTIAKGE